MSIGQMVLSLIAIFTLIVALVVAADRRDSARRNDRPASEAPK